ncbi:tryptophan--tRNA ligase [Malassezia sp. CBS 17886]|nr:tryptophan--tRNA ligase [Malassezia sp. CBS 17886]
MRLRLRAAGVSAWPRARGLSTAAANAPAPVTGNASAAETRKKRVIVSGIQPTGVPHVRGFDVHLSLQLGNYLGALKNWLDLQASAREGDEFFFFIAGLHALTAPQDPVQLFADRRNALASLLAIGLDPKRCTIFHQDQIPEHTELAWHIGCLAPLGRLERMTTWKSKLALLTSASDPAADHAQLQLGLFTYPVLQAADILMYNKTPGIPSSSKRILSLRNPQQKMSKSAPDASSRILITDRPETITVKIRRAVTDSERALSFDPTHRPAVSNLLSITAALGCGPLRDELRAANGNDAPVGPEQIAEVLNRSGGSGARLKQVLAESIIETLRPIQRKYTRLENEPGYLASLEAQGRERARERATQTMAEVRTLLGLQR